MEGRREGGQWKRVGERRSKEVIGWRGEVERGDEGVLFLLFCSHACVKPPYFRELMCPLDCVILLPS